MALAAVEAARRSLKALRRTAAVAREGRGVEAVVQWRATGAAADPLWPKFDQKI